MIKLIRVLLGIAGIIVIGAFAVSNRQVVEMGLWPLPTTINVQLFWVFIFGLVVGVLLGGIGMWLGGWKKRRAGRQARNKAWALENQVKAMKDQQQQAETKAYEERRAAKRALASPPSAPPLRQIAG